MISLKITLAMCIVLGGICPRAARRVGRRRPQRRRVDAVTLDGQVVGAANVGSGSPMSAIS
ncbi:MAG: hypothetical protein ACLRMJ_09765 [Alistipes finegoldii]